MEIKPSPVRRRTIMIDDYTAKRLAKIGGTIKRGVLLASFAADVSALLQAERDYWNPPSEGALPGQGGIDLPVQARTPTEAQLRDIHYITAEAQRRWRHYGYAQEFIDHATDADKWEMDAAIKEERSPAHLAVPVRENQK